MFYESRIDFYEIFIDSRAQISLFASFDRKYIFLITFFLTAIKIYSSKDK